MKNSSDAGRSKIIRNAVQKDQIPLPPIIELKGREIQFYLEIAQEMAMIELTPANRDLLGFLAQSMERLLRETDALKREGCVIVAPSGRTVLNPRRTSVANEMVILQNFRRALALSNNPGEAMTGKVRQRMRVKATEESARAAVAKDDPDDTALISKFN
jgi:hypothetical protein